MKKILWGILLAVTVIQSCKKDDDDDEVTSTTIIAGSLEEQNTWDDSCIEKFLNENYFDSKGNITAFDDEDDSDDNFPKLSSYNPVKLPSGVIYIVKPGAQPDPGKTIADDDALSMMQNSTSYLAAKNATTNEIDFTTPITFANTISTTGVPLYDPSFYYVKTSVLNAYNTTNNTSYTKSFYEIEGLKEGLKYFKSFSLDDSADYNLQGVIIVPSRAAFARDAHYPYSSTTTLQNRTFVFNFQIYNTKPRTEAGD